MVWADEIRLVGVSGGRMLHVPLRCPVLIGGEYYLHVHSIHSRTPLVAKCGEALNRDCKAPSELVCTVHTVYTSTMNAITIMQCC